MALPFIEKLHSEDADGVGWTTWEDYHQEDADEYRKEAFYLRDDVRKLS